LLKYAVKYEWVFFETQCFMKFLKTNISQGSVATCFKSDGIFNGHALYCKFTADFSGAEILKIGT